MSNPVSRSGGGMGPPVQAHGRIVSVDFTDVGSSLVADTAAGATELVVVNAADFPDQGGNLTINGQTIAYTAADDTTGTLSLAAALAADAGEGDDVSLWDDYRNDVAAQMRALVQFDGDDGGGDPVGAVVSQYLSYTLDEGVRGDTGESVLLEHKDGIWRVVDVLGHLPIIDLSFGTPDSQPLRTWFVNTDQATATGAGVDVVITLTRRPLLGSLHVYWNGLAQRPGVDFVWDGNQSVTITDFSNQLRAGDLLEAAYAYEAGTLVDYIPDLIGTADDGWTGTGATTRSLTIPAGVIAGDLLVVHACCDYQGLDPWPNNAKVFCSDARMKNAHTLRGGKVGIWWGFADGSGSPINLDFPAQTGHGGDIQYRASVLVAYRGAQVAGFLDGNPTGTLFTAPNLANTTAALLCLSHQDAVVVSGNASEDSGIWNAPVGRASNKCHASVFEWHGGVGGRGDVPPGAFNVHDTDGISTTTLLQLEAIQ